MSSNLGDKSHRLTESHISKITEIFGDLEANGRSIVVDNEEFGYRRIVADRPLRMSFKATPERIDSLNNERAFTNRDEETQQQVKEALSTLDSEKVWMDRDEFIEKVELCFNMHGVDVRNSVYDAIERALGERNPDAEIVTNSKGDPEHDTELRDRERVPLGEDVEEFFEREVQPYTENAWINDDSRYHDDKDGKLGVVGYEINFNRYFYEYNPPRSLSEIDNEIQELEREIMGLLEKVAR